MRADTIVLLMGELTQTEESELRKLGLKIVLLRKVDDFLSRWTNPDVRLVVVHCELRPGLSALMGMMLPVRAPKVPAVIMGALSIEPCDQNVMLAGRGNFVEVISKVVS